MKNVTQAKLPNLGRYIYDEMESIALDRLLAEAEALLPLVSTGPWMADVKENIGKNWHIASFGASDTGDWILTTDHIRCSEMESNDAEADAKFCALARNLMPLLIERYKVLVGQKRI